MDRFASRCGRKLVMLACGPIILSSWILALTTKSISALYAVRIIQGIAMAIPYAVTPMYIAEIAEPCLRGQLGSYFQVFFYIGVLYSYATGPYFEYQIYLYLECLPVILFIIVYSFMPESPYYLLMKEKEEEAYKALSWLRADEDVLQEFNDIKENVAEDMRNRGTWKALIATKKDRMALFIVEIVCLVRYTNGISTISLYITQTLTQGGAWVLNSDQMAIVLTTILIIVTTGASFAADTVGRRPLLLISTIGATLFHSVVAVYYYLHERTNVDVSAYMWISFIALLGFCVVANIGLGPLMSIMQAEYFPSHTRAKGAGITGVVTGVSCFVSIKTYQVVDDYFGIYMNYVIFALISLTGAIFFWAVVHETAGKSLGQVQKTLLSTSSESKFS
ncbi:facilitated trehalose transporter Tret1-like isoform X4 [Rhodnius prolixus]|uniref:facilitated trehalose transporter Tret1-like isoform X4 n=1 Tax=Rhodnius prolixus TaxID=13249 RepID=UPI003D18C146